MQPAVRVSVARAPTLPRDVCSSAPISIPSRRGARRHCTLGAAAVLAPPCSNRWWKVCLRDFSGRAFPEEEGVHLGIPFVGSRARLLGRMMKRCCGGRWSRAISVESAIRRFGLDPAQLPAAVLDPHAFAYLEFHIEQGPVLESMNEPLGVVESIAGQSRLTVHFTGQAAHAGTTPMSLRRDALAGAARWIARVEEEARSSPGLVATVGRLETKPGAGNVIPAQVTASLDVRHDRTVPGTRGG